MRPKTYYLSTWDDDGKRQVLGSFPPDQLDRMFKYIKDNELEHMEIKTWELTPENLAKALAYYNLEEPQ